MGMDHPARSGWPLMCMSLLQVFLVTLFPIGCVPNFGVYLLPRSTNFDHREDTGLKTTSEMSYGIMGGSRNSHLLTYQTTRPVKCIYFDGESAALFGNGQLDSQMLHLFGNTSGPAQPPGNGFQFLWQEYLRATSLCDWIEEKKLGGLGWGVEGVVRMNAGFEMIWCNFTSPTLRLVSHLNVSAPLLDFGNEKERGAKIERDKDMAPTSFPLPPQTTPADRAAPPGWNNDWTREPFYKMQTWNWFTSGAAHYGSNGGGAGLGETRVKVTSCGFLSYYASKFSTQALARSEIEQKSLNLTDEGFWTGPGLSASRTGGLTALTRRRRAHTLGEVSEEDAALMREDSERVLLSLLDGSASCSGMDWFLITSEVVQTYSGPLLSFLHTLKNFSSLPLHNETTLKEWMVMTRDLTHTFLVPFIQYPSLQSPQTYARNSALFNTTFDLCKYHHTRLVDPSAGFVTELNEEETLLKWAVENTTAGICGVLVDIGLSVESLWQAHFNTIHTTTTGPSMQAEVTRWVSGVEELMAWLGWAGEWTGCAQKCEWDERCFIPMWPLMNMGDRGGPGGGGPHGRPGYGGRYGRPGRGRGGYEGPGYAGPGGPGEGPRFGQEPSANDTGPGRGGFNWAVDERPLWEPRCIKYGYLSRD